MFGKIYLWAHPPSPLAGGSDSPAAALTGEEVVSGEEDPSAGVLAAEVVEFSELWRIRSHRGKISISDLKLKKKLSAQTKLF